jgi:HK97 family phage major capsid protein
MADISRVDAAGLLADQNINEILQEAAQSSAALATFRTVRMGTQIAQLPIMTVLPVAQWVNGDTGTKPTSEQAWEKKQLTAEELAVIVPIPENVFDDTSFGVWEEVRPRVAEALGAALDAAVFFGTNAPASFDDSLFEGATSAGQIVTEGDGVDLADDINLTWAEVEAVGFDVNAQYASRRIRYRLRGLRDDNNQPIYLESLRSDGSDRSLMGEQITWVQNGAWDSDQATLIAGDRTKAILGIRQDVTYKISDEATLTDGNGNVTFSLYEQDMVALRAKFRCGFVVADPITVETGYQSYPFAALAPTS